MQVYILCFKDNTQPLCCQDLLYNIGPNTNSINISRPSSPLTSFDVSCILFMIFIWLQIYQRVISDSWMWDGSCQYFLMLWYLVLTAVLLKLQGSWDVALWCWSRSSTLKMEAACSSETSLSTYKITQCKDSGNCYLKNSIRENMKNYVVTSLFSLVIFIHPSSLRLLVMKIQISDILHIFETLCRYWKIVFFLFCKRRWWKQTRLSRRAVFKELLQVSNPCYFSGFFLSVGMYYYRPSARTLAVRSQFHLVWTNPLRSVSLRVLYWRKPLRVLCGCICGDRLHYTKSWILNLK